MRCRIVFPSYVLLCCASLSSPAEQDAPVVSGYVTALEPSGEFAVKGVRVQLVPSTVLATRRGLSLMTIPTLGSVFLGEKIEAFGDLDKKKHTLRASKVVVIAGDQPSPVHGTAIIDADPGTTSEGRVVRADGYLLQLTSTSTLTFTPPLKALSDLGTNIWITYTGVRQSDGRVLVASATFSTNTVRHTEDKLRKKTEYDPKAVDEGDRQGAISKGIRGVDPKKLPAYNDAAMQDRVARIGLTLVPAFQRALSADDPTKIDFRFQVVDSRDHHDALSLTSGIILVPKDLVERMQNDSQLATVLADNIAEVLEKQTVRDVPPRSGLLAAQVAGAVGGAFVPGLGIASSVAAGGAGDHLVTLEHEQSGRVSLFLLKDAGYDLSQAPLAWWLLASKKPKPIDTVSLPARAANLYLALGTTWRQTQLSPAP